MDDELYSEKYEKLLYRTRMLVDQTKSMAMVELPALSCTHLEPESSTLSSKSSQKKNRNLQKE